MLTFGRDDINIHFRLPPKGYDFNMVAIDTEWFGQEKRRLHRPHGKFACMGCTYNGKDVYMIFKTEEIAQFFENISKPMHVYHNAQYDIRQLRRYADIPERRNIWDTMIIEQIRFSGYYRKFSLADLSRRYLKTYMDKDVRDSFSEECSDAVMSDEQIFYAAVDIIATWHVAKAQQAQMDDDDKNIWERIEKPFLWTLLDTKGIYFEGENWKTRYEDDKVLSDKLSADLPFNPRSHTQIKEFFAKHYRIKLKATDEDTLDEVFAEHPEIPELQKIVASRKAYKAYSTYGKSWITAVEEDGRLYPPWKQIGAETGRMSAGADKGVKGASKGSLAIQTIPHDKRYRSSFIAAPNHTLCINDYSSQEPKELAYITGDENLIRIFQEKKDVYIEVGYIIFGERFDKKDPRRQQMKSIILGISYGMSKVGLAVKLGVSVKEAQDLLNMFYAKFPAVKKWVDSCAIWKPYVTTILGRKFWGNPYMYGWERNYRNFPMQGSAVDCTKMAANRIRRIMGYNPTVIYMHDELVCEFPDEDLEKGKEVMTKCMVELQEWMVEGQIPGGIEQFVGHSWAEK